MGETGLGEGGKQKLKQASAIYVHLFPLFPFLLPLIIYLSHEVSMALIGVFFFVLLPFSLFFLNRIGGMEGKGGNGNLFGDGLGNGMEIV